MSSANFKKFIPLLNRVLIQKLDPVKKSKAGIILSTKDTNSFVGKVVAVGPGLTNDKGINVPVSVPVGANVLLPDFGGMKVEISSGEFYIYRDTELVGVLEEPTN